MAYGISIKFSNNGGFEDGIVSDTLSCSAEQIGKNLLAYSSYAKNGIVFESGTARYLTLNAAGSGFVGNITIKGWGCHPFNNQPLKQIEEVIALNDDRVNGVIYFTSISEISSDAPFNANNVVFLIGAEFGGTTNPGLIMPIFLDNYRVPFHTSISTVATAGASSNYTVYANISNDDLNQNYFKTFGVVPTYLSIGTSDIATNTAWTNTGSQMTGLNYPVTSLFVGVNDFDPTNNDAYLIFSVLQQGSK